MPEHKYDPKFEYDIIGICDTADRLKSQRSALEASWSDLSSMVLPGRFNNGSKQSNGKRDSLDSTAALAAENLGMALCGLAVNPAREWFEPVSPDQNAKNDVETVNWFQNVGGLMRAELNRQGSRFYVEAQNLIKELVTFGTAVFFSEEIGLSGQFSFTTRPLDRTCFDQNANGQIDRAYYRFLFTARQCIEKWGEAAPKAAHKAVDDGDLHARFDLMHAVIPAGSGNDGKFASLYIHMDSQTLISKGQYHEFPYQVVRWSSVPQHVYGFSPAMMALPDIKFLNTVVKTNLVAAQKAVDPPLLAVNENGLRGLKTHPGAIIYGGLDASGRRMYEPLMQGATQSSAMSAQEDQKREQIREAFFHSLLFSTLQNQMTATEFLGRYEEKARVLAPHLAAIQAEFLTPFLQRLYGLMHRAGKLPDVPENMAGGKKQVIEVSFNTPLTRAQKSEDASVALKLLAGFAPYLGDDLMALNQIDSAKMVRDLAIAVGLPLKEVGYEETTNPDKAGEVSA
ncbi:MAG: portal protein [Alphaproteobacteria bacterium]